MAKKFTAFAELKGSDKASGPIVGAFRRIAVAGKATRQTFANILSPLRTVNSALGMLGVGLTAVAAYKALTGYAERADELGVFAQQVGLSVEALQEYQHAAALANVPTEDFNRALGIFTRNVGQAKAGTGAMAAMLKRVAPSMLPAIRNAKSTDEALSLVLDALAALPSEAQRAAFAQAVFGRSGATMIRLAADYRKGREEARKFELVTAADAAAANKFGDSLDGLKAAGRGAMNEIGRQALPILTDAVQDLTKYLIDNREEIGKWGREAFTDLKDAVLYVRDHWTEIKSTIKTVVYAYLGIKAISVLTQMVSLGRIWAATMAAGGKWLSATPTPAGNLPTPVPGGGLPIPGKAKVAGKELARGLPLLGAALALAEMAEPDDEPIRLIGEDSVEARMAATGRDPVAELQRARDAERLPIGDTSIAALARAASAPRPVAGKIVVEFKNAPAGMTAVPQSDNPGALTLIARNIGRRAAALGGP